MKVITTAIVAMLGLGLVVSSAAPSEAAKPAWRAHDARFERNHPRRDQVLDRNQNLNRRINANAGKLDGHFGQLKREDRAIIRQEQRDARMNGGHITKQEQQQLNREENRLNNQIKRDH